MSSKFLIAQIKKIRNYKYESQKKGGDTKNVDFVQKKTPPFLMGMEGNKWVFDLTTNLIKIKSLNLEFQMAIIYNICQ